MSLLNVVSFAFSTILAVSGIAQAGGAVEAGVEDHIGESPSAMPQDWGGFYAGVSWATAGSTNTYYRNGAFFGGPHDLEGNVPGLMAGYNWQRGSFVYGVEMAANLGTVRGLPTSGFDEQEFRTFIDLKGRAGYAAGKALFYGTVSYTTAEFTEDYIMDYVAIDGFGYGLGVDYALGSRVFAGLEYLHRDLSGNLDYAPGFSLDDTEINTLTLRIGAKF